MRALSGLLIALLYCQTGLAAVKSKIPVVFANPVSQTELSNTLIYPARLDSSVHAQVRAESQGVVTKIFIPLGTKVRRGQKILKIEHLDPVYNYAPAIITAPVNGAISEIKLTEGSQVQVGQHLLTVSDPRKINVYIEVAAADISLLKRGTKGELLIPQSETPYEVSVKGVSPIVDPATGTASGQLIILRKNKAKELLRPGIVGQVRFKANKRMGYQVPDSAVRYKEKDPYLRVVKDGISKNTPVKIGIKSQGKVEILEGIKAGDMVIERASRHVADGDKVTLENPKKKSKPTKKL